MTSKIENSAEYLLGFEDAKQETLKQVEKMIDEHHFNYLQDELQRIGYCAGEILAIIDEVRKELKSKLFKMKNGC